MTGDRENLAELVVDFARVLREAGVKCSIPEVIDAFNAVLYVGLNDLEKLREALRSTLVKDPEHYKVFEEVFEYFWEGRGRPRQGLQARRFMVRIVSERDLDPVSRFLNVYSPLEVSWKNRIARMDTGSGKRREISRTVRTYLRLLALEASRRRILRAKGEESLRYSMKRSLKTFGEIVKIARTTKKRVKARLVIVADVSGSMSDEWEWLYELLAAVKKLPSGRYEVFLFSTRLFRATELLETHTRLEEALHVIMNEFMYWGGGTRIGEALETLVKEYPGILKKKTGVLIVSDGWDLGDLEKLEKSLAEIKRRVGHMAWITPHASKPGFAPATSCLQIALNYVDALLPKEALENPRLLATLLQRWEN